MRCNCTLTGDSLTLLRRPHVNGALQPWKKRTRRSYTTCRGNIRGRFPNWWRSERGCWLRRRPPRSLVICENVLKTAGWLSDTTCIELAKKNDGDADLLWQTLSRARDAVWCSAGHLPYLSRLTYFASVILRELSEWAAPDIVSNFMPAAVALCSLQLLTFNEVINSFFVIRWLWVDLNHIWKQTRKPLVLFWFHVLLFCFCFFEESWPRKKILKCVWLFLSM